MFNTLKKWYEKQSKEALESGDNLAVFNKYQYYPFSIFINFISIFCNLVLFLKFFSEHNIWSLFFVFGFICGLYFHFMRKNDKYKMYILYPSSSLFLIGCIFSYSSKGASVALVIITLSLFFIILSKNTNN
ncbi:hypothetical protein GE253_11835 [Niveispirillum sp. SYP-B3756]|uniref:hypothetical protein n=1 Tax=Niveispirillum sp. SYP-B3756 TaxID=2662178 RepID=UPI00129116A0|nr:hypothetical protein [Niveispirillum sp. SYP-B3756]MQP66030.1 hypothetical protein [Niveispirillum sp. SYP-B3756]